MPGKVTLSTFPHFTTKHPDQYQLINIPEKNTVLFAGVYTTTNLNQQNCASESNEQIRLSGLLTENRLK